MSSQPQRGQAGPNWNPADQQAFLSQQSEHQGNERRKVTPRQRQPQPNGQGSSRQRRSEQNRQQQNPSRQPSNGGPSGGRQRSGQSNRGPSQGPRSQPNQSAQGPFELNDTITGLLNSKAGKPLSRGQQKRLGRARAREERWQNNRLAVPYRTDGPKITFGIIWFILLVGSAVLGLYTGDAAVASLGIAVVCAPVAGLAGLQAAHAWFPQLSAPKLWMASAAYLIGLSGFFAVPGVIIGAAFGVLAVSLYVLLYRGHQRRPLQLMDVLARSAIPAGVAIASLAAIAQSDVSALVSLILLVSAYEAGDFLVGSGSANALEGPLAGLVALGAVTFLLFLTLPPPFSERTVLLFALVTAICCPLGQVVASGLLPRGVAWAPALRRLDSYLIAAPLWLMLLGQIPQVT